MRRSRRHGARISGVVAVFAMAGTLIASGAPSASAADGGILGSVPIVGKYVGMAEQAYSMYRQYVLGQKPPSSLDQFQSLIEQSQVQILGQMDAIATASVQSCARTAVQQLPNIEAMTTTRRQQFAADTVRCVEDAKALIHIESSRAAVDNLGFALNVVGPIALFAAADADQATDILVQDLIAANTDLRIRLKPTCEISILSPDNLPSFGEGAVTGKGACYGYTVATPERVANGTVTYVPAGPGVAFLPWSVRGLAIPVDDRLPQRGYRIAYPLQSDWSIAVNEAVAATSSPIAEASIRELSTPLSRPFGTTLAAASSTRPDSPFEAFGVDPNGRLISSTVSPGRLASWHAVPGAPVLKSVAAASNIDGRLEVFGVNKLGQIFHRWQQTPADNESWSPWAEMDGELTSIAVARNANGTLQVFGTNRFGTVMTRSQQPKDAIAEVAPAHPGPAIDNWTTWTRMGNGFVQLAAGSRNNKIEIFGLDTSGTIFRRFQNAADAVDPSVDGAWSSWQSTGSQGASLALTPGVGGEAQLFTTYADTAYQLTETPDGTFSNGWVPLAGRIHSELSAAKADNDVVLLMGADATGASFVNLNVGGFVGGWLGWSPVSGSKVLLSGNAS